MRVWDAVGGGSIHFDSAELGEPDLGHIVENRVTQLALWERLEAADEVTLLCPAAAGEIELRRCGPVGPEDGRRLRHACWWGPTDGTRGCAAGRHRHPGLALRPAGHRGQRAGAGMAPGDRLAALPAHRAAGLPAPGDGRCSIVWSATRAGPRSCWRWTRRISAASSRRPSRAAWGRSARSGRGPPFRCAAARQAVREAAPGPDRGRRTRRSSAGGQGVNLGFWTRRPGGGPRRGRDKRRDIGGFGPCGATSARAAARTCSCWARWTDSSACSATPAALAALRSAGLSAGRPDGPGQAPVHAPRPGTGRRSAAARPSVILAEFRIAAFPALDQQIRKFHLASEFWIWSCNILWLTLLAATPARSVPLSR